MFEPTKGEFLCHSEPSRWQLPTETTSSAVLGAHLLLPKGVQGNARQGGNVLPIVPSVRRNSYPHLSPHSHRTKYGILIKLSKSKLLLVFYGELVEEKSK